MKNRYGYKVLFCLLVVWGYLHSQTQSVLLKKDILVIKTEGVAFLGTGITEDDAKTLAINDAKRNAMELAGTYLESHTEVLNYTLVKDEIITYTGGLLKVKVLEEGRSLINDMFAFRVRILSAIDTKLLNERIKEIRSNRALKKQLEAERERNNRLAVRIAELQASGSTSKETEIEKVISSLSASEWFYKGIDAKDPYLEIEYYTKAIELEPESVEAYYNRGCVYSNLARHEEAIQDYTKAIELYPNFADAYINRGNDYHRLKRDDEAIRDFNISIKLNPDAHAYNGRGIAYGSLGLIPEAIQDLSTAIQLDSKIYSVYYNRGNFYSDLKHYDEAIQDFNTAIYLNPKDAAVYNSRGKAFIFLGLKDEALRDFTKAIELDLKNVAAFIGRGNVYKLFGRYDQAINDYSKAIELDPNDPIACFSRGNTYFFYLKENEKAVSDYNEYLKLNGNKDGDAEIIRQRIRDLGHIPKY